VETNEARDTLKMIMMELSIEFGDFTLKSGKKSRYYIDARRTTLDPEGARLTGILMHRLIREKLPGTASIGGPTLGADPIVVATGIAGLESGSPLRLFLVRKEVKGHGTRKAIEGHLRPGDSVAIVEDVITTGGSILHAIEEVEAANGVVGGVFVLVDRKQGGKEHLESLGYPVHSIFTIDLLIPPDILEGSQ